MPGPDHAVEQCLRELQAGDDDALGRLMPLVYDELRALARGLHAPAGQSLNPTALVHEVYARLVQTEGRTYNDRRHFVRVAALAMRQLLADHARERRAQKRGGGVRQVTLHSWNAQDPGVAVDLVDLDEALERLASIYPRHAQIAELRFLAGLSVEETAEVLGVSSRTVKADWHLARAWLSRELRAE